MMTLQEVLECIKESVKERDILYEHTPENEMVLERRKGTFEAVMSGKGNEKYLIPEAGVLHFLFRGQTQEHPLCLPTIYRKNPSELQIFLDRMRLTVFKRMLDTYPIISDFFKRHNFVVDVEGLAQHYGLNTSVLDLTSNIDIAMFFATCPFDSDKDSYSYYNEGEHEGVLYVFDPLLDNEPCPDVCLLTSYMRGNIRPIGLQAFKRPGAQEGYALHIPKGCSTKSWIYKFKFTAEDSKYYYDKFMAGKALWIKDELIAKAKEIKNQLEFSFSVFNETFESYAPKGYSKTRLKKALTHSGLGISFNAKKEDVIFTQKEKEEIIKKWNSGEGEAVCKKIVRKPWFNHERINDETKMIEGIHNRHEFNTFDHLSEFMMIQMCASPKPPIKAEWRNYMRTPRKPSKCPTPSVGVIEARMDNVFGKPWLTEKDWHIELPM